MSEIYKNNQKRCSMMAVKEHCSWLDVTCRTQVLNWNASMSNLTSCHKMSCLAVSRTSVRDLCTTVLLMICNCKNSHNSPSWRGDGIGSITGMKELGPAHEEAKLLCLVCCARPKRLSTRRRFLISPLQISSSTSRRGKSTLIQFKAWLMQNLIPRQCLWLTEEALPKLNRR